MLVYVIKTYFNQKKKVKSAFYNCFVVILRLLINNRFKEIHIKIFNTGKLEIPGARNDDLLIRSINYIINLLQPYSSKPFHYIKESIKTVLINSNFSCNYYINRNKLYNKLRYKYNLHVIFDPCSYPGVQTKYYYNLHNEKNDGVCYCTKKCNKGGTGNGNGQCKKISFMIFRTGSILIVGNCNENILRIIYEFIKKLLKREYNEIYVDSNVKKKVPKKKRIRKHTILSFK